jgi:hypothetical protein
MADKRETTVVDSVGLRLKDWISLGLSILAFGLSAVTTYYNIWRQEDDISVVAELGAFAIRTSKDRLFIEKGLPTKIAFLNSGNRPAAIMNVTLSFFQARLLGDDGCPVMQSTSINTDFAPLVIKPGDVATASVRLADGRWYENDEIKKEESDRYSFLVRPDNLELTRFPVEVCLDVRLSTPSHGSHFRSVSIYKYWVEGEKGGWSWSFDGEGPTIDKPIVLLKERSWLYWN